MPISGKKYRFTKENVDNSPDGGGVYALFDEDVLIYYGRAKSGSVTIRSRLQSHCRGDDGSCTQRATHYQRETCTNPVSREVALLEEYKRRFGKLPRCNARVG